jgi:predicted ABC-type ATPase
MGVLDEIAFLAERTARVGEVRFWKSKGHVEKQRDGTWKVLSKKRAATIRRLRRSLKGKEHGVLSRTRPTPDFRRRWIDTVPELPEDTTRAHFDPPEGGWTGGWSDLDLDKAQPNEERQKIHDFIISKHFDSVPVVPRDVKPVAVLMMGGPGSGKSTAKRGMDLSGFVVVDADDIKDDLPEFQTAIAMNARDAAKIVHSESDYIGRTLRKRAVEERKNLMIDGTGRSAEDYEQQIDALRDEGFFVAAMFCHLDDVNVALERVRERAERTGRYVPEHVVLGAYRDVPANFDRIASLSDDYAMFDTGGEQGRVVWEGVGGKATVYDQEVVGDFRQQYDVAMIEALREIGAVLTEKTDEEDKKPDVDTNSLFDDFAKALTSERKKLLKKAPKFPSNDGVEMVVDDGLMRIG